MEKLEKGEKVLMYTLDEESAEPLVYGEHLIDSPNKEVTVIGCQNVLSFNIVTVRDNDGNCWCGSHIEDKRLGRICFIRKAERIHVLRDIYDALYVDFKAPNREDRLEKLMGIMGNECNHQFVVLKNRDNELPVMQCIHCGLTNLWEEVRAKDADYVTFNGRLQIDTFNTFLQREFGSTCVESTRGIDILSYEEYPYKNLKEAHRKAIAKKPEATGKELVELMQEIDQGLARPFEKNRMYPNV